MHLIFEKSCRSCNPGDIPTHSGSLRGSLALDGTHTAPRWGAKIQTQTLNLQKAAPPMATFTMGSVKHREGLWARDSGLSTAGVAHVQAYDSPPWLLALARVFLRMFRAVLLEQMPTTPKVGSISPCALQRGVQGSGGSKGSEPTQPTGSLSPQL